MASDAEMVAIGERLEAMGLRRDESGWYDEHGVHVVGRNDDGTWWTQAIDSTPGNGIPDARYDDEAGAAIVYLMEAAIRLSAPDLAARAQARQAALGRLMSLPGGLEEVSAWLARWAPRERVPNAAHEAAAVSKRERKAKRRLEVGRG